MHCTGGCLPSRSEQSRWVRWPELTQPYNNSRSYISQLWVHYCRWFQPFEHKSPAKSYWVETSHEMSDKRTGYSRFVVNQHGWPFFNTREFSPVWPPDHGTVIVQPKERVPHQHTRKSITIKGTRESKKSSLGQYLGSIDWSHVNDQSTCEEKASDFRLTGRNWHEQHRARNDHQSLPQERPLDVSEAEGANTHALDHLSFQ